MSDRTITHPPHLQAGKAATKALIRAAGGQEAASAETHKSQPRLSSYGAPNTADFIPINDVAALEAITHGAPGHPPVTRWLARQAGFTLVKLPTAPGGFTDFHRAIGAVSKEVGEAVELVCEALGNDNQVTADEVRDGRIVENIDEAIERLLALRALALNAPEIGA
jgi:hypothetical protein